MRFLMDVIFSPLGPMRYMISAIVTFIVLVYGLGTQFGYLPLYTLVAANIGIPPTTLMFYLYAFVTLVVGSYWYVAVMRQPDPLDAQVVHRQLYRQTDRAGLIMLDLLIVGILVWGAVFVLRSYSQAYLRDAGLFIAGVVLVPFLADLWWPTQRVRRVVVPRDGRTLAEIAHNVAPNTAPQQIAIESLRGYNEDLMATVYDDPQELLPDSMVIEIPPAIPPGYAKPAPAPQQVPGAPPNTQPNTQPNTTTPPATTP